MLREETRPRARLTTKPRPGVPSMSAGALIAAVLGVSLIARVAERRRRMAVAEVALPVVPRLAGAAPARLAPLALRPGDQPANRPSPARAPATAVSLSLRAVASLYLAVIGAAELLTAVIDPFWGFVAHLGILGALLAHATLASAPGERSFFLSVAIAPMIRIVTLGMPLGQFDQQWWYLLSATPLFVASLAVMRVIPLTAWQVGLRLPARGDWRLTIGVILSGFVLGIGEYLVLRPAPIVRDPSPASLLLAFLILLVGTGLLEELIFRGILQETATAVLGTTPGIVVVSLLFGVLHIGHLSVVDVFFVTAVAFYFALVMRRTRTLLGITIAHGLTNFMLFVVLPTIFSG